MPRRGLDLRVTAQLADHRQALARCDGGRGEGVAGIVDAGILQPGPGSDPLPEGLQIGQALAFQGTRDHPRIACDPWRGLQMFDGRLAEVHDLGTALGVLQAQHPVGEVDVLPLMLRDRHPARLSTG
jgi:hypothetical protein